MKTIKYYIQLYKRYKRIKKIHKKMKGIKIVLESDAMEYLRFWTFGFTVNRSLKILRENYKRFYNTL